MIKTDELLIKFSNRINPDAELKYIDRKIEPFSIVNECYSNVEHKIKKDGGKSIYGWLVYRHQINGLNLLEARAHAIWQSNDGNLICITPNDDSYFLKDTHNIVGPDNPIPNFRYFLDQDTNTYNLAMLLEVIDYMQHRIVDYINDKHGVLPGRPYIPGYDTRKKWSFYILDGDVYYFDFVSHQLMTLLDRCQSIILLYRQTNILDANELKNILDALSYKVKYSFKTI